MDDSDLNYLRRILSHMDGDDIIGIGITNWTVGDLGWVVDQAIEGRRLAAESAVAEPAL